MNLEGTRDINIFIPLLFLWDWLVACSDGPPWRVQADPRGELYLNAKGKIIPKSGEVERAELYVTFRKCRQKGGDGRWESYEKKQRG